MMHDPQPGHFGLAPRDGDWSRDARMYDAYRCKDCYEPGDEAAGSACPRCGDAICPSCSAEHKGHCEACYELIGCEDCGAIVCNCKEKSNV